jgi:flagellar motor protein MotB
MRFSTAGFTLLALVPFVSLSTGCQSKLYDENVALHQQNRELQQRLTESDTRLRSAPDPNQMATMQQELTARDQKIAELQAQLNNPSPNVSSEESSLLQGIEVTRDERAGTLTVNLPGDVLFASGSAEVKPTA